MKSTVGVGIVGYGKVGAGAHRRWVTARDTAKLVAVSDVTEVRRAAAQDENPGVHVYERYEDLLADPGVDLIIVTTPPNSHRDLAVQAAEAGKHVFVDKPFAMTLGEAEVMLAAAEANGVVMHCHQSRRYDGEYRAILQAVRAGRIGRVEHVRRVWSQFGMGWATWGIAGFNPTWRVQRAYGGGMVYDYAPHLGDQVLHLIGQPIRTVFADARGIRFSNEVDDHFSCTVRFAEGATAYLEASNLSRLSAPHWYVTGTEGCITAEKVNGPITLLAEGMAEPEVLEPVNVLDELYDNLLDACRGDAAPNVTGEELRASMSLIDAIFVSAVSGESVTLG